MVCHLISCEQRGQLSEGDEQSRDQSGDGFRLAMIVAYNKLTIMMIMVVYDWHSK